MDKYGQQWLNVYGGFALGCSQDKVVPAKTSPLHDLNCDPTLGDGNAPVITQDNWEAYMVQACDTLEGIALQVYGDASLWYVLADANGIQDKNAQASNNQEALHIGQRLLIPAVATSQHHHNTTRKLLDGAYFIGNTSASAPMLALPAPTPQKHHAHGGLFGKIVTGIVAVVATVLTAGILGVIAGAASAASSLFGLGCSILSGTASNLGLGGLLATGFSAGVIGNLASQGVAKTFGLQEHIDATGSLISGLTTAVSAGLLRGLNIENSPLHRLGKALTSAGGNQTTFNVLSAAQMMEENAVNQGLNFSLRKQQHFDWAQLGISGLSAGLLCGAKGQALNDTLRKLDFNTGILNAELNALGQEGVHYNVLHMQPIATSADTKSSSDLLRAIED